MFITSKAKNDAVFAVSVKRAVRVAFAGPDQATKAVAVTQRDVRVAFRRGMVRRLEVAGNAADDGGDNRCASEAAGYRRAESTSGKAEWVGCSSDFPPVMPL